MEKRIVYTREDGGVSVIIPAPDFEGSMGELAAATVPAGLTWSEVEASSIPASRNWRDAWKKHDTENLVHVDLEKAKACHRALIISKARDRVQADAFGQRDFTQVKQEMEALGIDQAADLQTLFNLWPASINRRQQPRTYQEHPEVA